MAIISHSLSTRTTIVSIKLSLSQSPHSSRVFGYIEFTNSLTYRCLIKILSKWTKLFNELFYVLCDVCVLRGNLVVGTYQLALSFSFVFSFGLFLNFLHYRCYCWYSCVVYFLVNPSLKILKALKLPALCEKQIENPNLFVEIRWNHLISRNNFTSKHIKRNETKKIQEEVRNHIEFLGTKAHIDCGLHERIEIEAAADDACVVSR